ncbi:hypothetical protein FH972_025893 [Carpinus fangiana]|uniref:glucan endo-1,6-beta-glucosidase n=1 Tax=Carpinus fangiana TaxID=176857 RepID=A0A5N6L3B6_9ROSI|nr:hypothetical protein FH972_025893 [Carpinus fangiana]
MHGKILAGLAATASVASAWMPADRDLAAFNSTARHEQEGALHKLGKRFLPDVDKVRGVNLGGWLIVERFFSGDDYWQNTLGCPGGAGTEFDCMLQTNDGNDNGVSDKFKQHWASWITPDTIDDIYNVGLNTVRIPIDNGEHFPDATDMMQYVAAVCKRAQEKGIFVIMGKICRCETLSKPLADHYKSDLHAAPYAQQQDAFTGQANSPAGFFSAPDGYSRAEEWLSWMTELIHNDPDSYGSVGIIEVLNEPVSNHDYDGDIPRYPAPNEQESLTTDYYPNALKAVRDAEAKLQITDPTKQLHVQFMDQKWGSGDPTDSQEVKDDTAVVFDDHNYEGFAMKDANTIEFMQYACQNDDRTDDGETPKIVQEWSLTSNIDPSDTRFYHDWFIAQAQNYEATLGWVFWQWKTNVDFRWTYSGATALGIVANNHADLVALAHFLITYPPRRAALLIRQKVTILLAVLILQANGILLHALPQRIVSLLLRRIVRVAARTGAWPHTVGTAAATRVAASILNLLALELLRARLRAAPNEDAGHGADDHAEGDAGPVESLCAGVHLAFADGGQSAADEDVDEQLWADDGGGQGKGPPVDGGDCGDGAVGEAVWERAEADHAEQLDAVVLERQGEGGEAGVVGEEAVDVGGEDVAGDDEGCGAADHGGRGDDEPAVKRWVVSGLKGCKWSEEVEDLLVEDEKEDEESVGYDRSNDEADLLQKREAIPERHDTTTEGGDVVYGLVTVAGRGIERPALAKRTRAAVPRRTRGGMQRLFLAVNGKGERASS